MGCLPGAGGASTDGNRREEARLTGNEAVRASSCRLLPPLISPPLPSHRTTYFARGRRKDKRDFLRSAVARCTTPALAALSKAELSVRSSLAASSFLPAVMSSR